MDVEKSFARRIAGHGDGFDGLKVLGLRMSDVAGRAIADGRQFCLSGR